MWRVFISNDAFKNWRERHAGWLVYSWIVYFQRKHRYLYTILSLYVCEEVVTITASALIRDGRCMPWNTLLQHHGMILGRLHPIWSECFPEGRF